VYLLVYGLCLGGVGLADVYRGLDVRARMDGSFLVVAAIAIVGGCSVALRSGARAAVRQWTARGADLAVCVVCLWILFRVQSNFVFQPVLTRTAVVVTSAMLLAVCLLWGDVRESPEQLPAGQAQPSAASTDTQAKSTLQAAVVGVVGTLLAASLTLPQFWYSVYYGPYKERPVVQVGSSIESVDPRGEHVELTVEITVENKGKAPVRMLTSLYKITGTRFLDPPRERTLPFEDITGGNYGSPARVSPYTQYAKPEQIQVGPVGRDYGWIGPDEEVKTTLLARAPRQRDFDLYRITVDVAVARADLVDVGNRSAPTRRTETCDGVELAVDRRPIAHRGTFDRLTESDREAVTYWVVDGSPQHGDTSPWWPPFPWNGVSIQHAGHDCGHPLKPGPDHDGLEDKVMVAWAGAVAEAGRPEEGKDKP
jgi:hypothetical protein